MAEVFNSSDEELSLDEDCFRTQVLGAIGHKESSRVRKRGWLLSGEKICVEERNIGFLSPVGKIIGKVVVTNYRLRFESNRDGAVPGGGARISKQCLFNMPLGIVSRVEKVGHSTVSRGEDAYGLEIICKNMRNIKFSSKQENHSRRPLFECLQKYAFPLSNKLSFFAFTYAEKFSTDGWIVYDPVKEFKRMGIPNDTWKLTRINDRYEFADTYPSLMCIPAQALQDNDDFLNRVAAFRSKSRIPVLSWLHAETQASLTRSSQPMVGMTNRKSTDDERYLQLLIDANAQSDRLFIMDARPEVNAKVNKAKGGGYESDDNYSNCQLVFLDIQNIHVMRESLRKVKDICYPKIDDKSWFTALEDTHWLDHIKTVMLGASRVVDKIENQKTSVLVHCSDGWDRTAQLVSLAMLMLDPYYRTLKGFQVLIEKEWCSAGHKFSHRIGHGEDKHGDSERSPVFLQFIDCTWQLSDQFPNAFEFNEFFLITILDELYSCRFGTFLYNCERERFREAECGRFDYCLQQVREKTSSLWSYVNSRRRRFVNPLYAGVDGDGGGGERDVLLPNCSCRRLKLWRAYYLRYNPQVNAYPRMMEQLRSDMLLNHTIEELRSERNRLKSQQNVESPVKQPSPAMRATQQQQTVL